MKTGETNKKIVRLSKITTSEKERNIECRKQRKDQ